MTTGIPPLSPDRGPVPLVEGPGALNQAVTDEMHPRGMAPLARHAAEVLLVDDKSTFDDASMDGDAKFTIRA